MPATTACPGGWTLEYRGYQMGSYPSDPAGHDWVCMDSAMETRHDWVCMDFAMETRHDWVCMDVAMETRLGGRSPVNGPKLFSAFTDCASR